MTAIFACGSADCPKPFALYRSEDVTGVSGSGTVAHGAQFADGTVVIRWLGKHASTVVWASLDAAVKVHGHDGRTRVVWLAADFSEMALAESEAAAAERSRVLADVRWILPGLEPGAEYLPPKTKAAYERLRAAVEALPVAPEPAPEPDPPMEPLFDIPPEGTS